MVASLCVPYVLHESYTLNVLQSRVHGLDHWFRVWKNAEMLSDKGSPADLNVVALYALFHDSMRMNDGGDLGHGTRGFRLWERFNQLQDVQQYLTKQQVELKRAPNTATACAARIPPLGCVGMPIVSIFIARGYSRTRDG
jgi:HD superfamily phosphodiesterase